MKKCLFVMLCLLILLPLHIHGQDATAQSIVSLANAARYQADVPDLLLSIELTTAAQRHSDDMAGRRKLDHVGDDGSQFWERMSDAGYSLTTGAENILLRSDTNARAVFNQWWNSPPHRANMLNRDYVEVGIAYTQATDGIYYFTMVLGKRDSVSAPALPSQTPIPPTFTPIPPTNTMIPPTATQTPLPTLTFTPTPLIPPTRTLSPLITPIVFTPIPTDAPTIAPTATPELLPDIRLIYDAESLTILNISGRRLNWSELSFRSDSGEMVAEVWDTEFLTGPLNNFADGDCLQVWSLRLNLMIDKVNDCDVRHGWIAVSDAQLFWQDVNSFFVLNEGDVIGQCIVLDGECELSLEAEYEVVNESSLPLTNDRDIRLIYNQNSLTILNIKDVPVDLRGVIFQNTSDTLPIELWNTEFLTTSLSSLPSGDCLMAWTSGIDSQPTPLDCKTRHGWIVVNDLTDVWRNVTRFEVVRDNRVLAGCVVANGFCDINLNGNLGANSPTVVPANPIVSSDVSSPSSSGDVSSGNDLTLVYSQESFSLINTSGRILDIATLVFESDNGVFAANGWNTDFLTRSLADFPSGDCLQVWGVNEQLVPKPSACSTRHGWVAVRLDQQFWRNTSQIRVRYGAEQIATCNAGVGQCVVNFP